MRGLSKQVRNKGRHEMGNDQHVGGGRLRNGRAGDAA
jgi:hypothetical protein